MELHIFSQHKNATCFEFAVTYRKRIRHNGQILHLRKQNNYISSIVSQLWDFCMRHSLNILAPICLDNSFNNMVESFNFLHSIIRSSAIFSLFSAEEKEKCTKRLTMQPLNVYNTWYCSVLAEPSSICDVLWDSGHLFDNVYTNPEFSPILAHENTVTKIANTVVMSVNIWLCTRIFSFLFSLFLARKVVACSLYTYHC